MVYNYDIPGAYPMLAVWSDTLLMLGIALASVVFVIGVLALVNMIRNRMK